MHSDTLPAGTGPPARTDWRQIVQLYDQLMAVAPSPVVALHRAVAVAEVAGPAAALTLVDGLDLGSYYLFHAVRGRPARTAGPGRRGGRRLRCRANPGRQQRRA